jgi:uncharacterized protein
MLWRRLDQPGHEAARLIEQDGTAVLEGSAVFVELGKPCRLDYAVTCDTRGLTRAATVHGWLGSSPIRVDIAADADQNWTLNGVPYASVDGCADIDLSFSPSTNMLSIRRLLPKIGQRVNVRAAWLRFPECSLEPLDQIYERMTESTYRYESVGNSFEVYLKVNDAGFVTCYPGLWQEEV